MEHIFSRRGQSHTHTDWELIAHAGNESILPNEKAPLSQHPQLVHLPLTGIGLCPADAWSLYSYLNVHAVIFHLYISTSNFLLHWN